MPTLLLSTDNHLEACKGTAVEHVVFYTGADGAAQYRRTPSLEEAVRVVEHLRNVEGVDEARVYSLTEVPLAFKTVYRVEIPGMTEAPAAPPAPPAPPAAVAPLPPMPPMPELVAEAAPAAPAAPEATEVAPEPAPAEEPVMAAVPSEPFAAEPAPEPVSNGRRGTGFFAR